LFCTSVCAKDWNMDVEENWGNVGVKMKKKVRNEDEEFSERGLFIPLIKNESEEERAIRILAMMEESNNRLSRVLEIFNRMNR